MFSWNPLAFSIVLYFLKLYFILLFIYYLFGCAGSWLWYVGFSNCSRQAQLLQDMWDLSSLTRDLTHVSCIARQILNHWTSGKTPLYFKPVPSEIRHLFKEALLSFTKECCLETKIRWQMCCLLLVVSIYAISGDGRKKPHTTGILLTFLHSKFLPPLFHSECSVSP